MIPTPDRSSDDRGEERPDSRSRILRAARQVLAERGLSTTVDDVAARAGVSRRTVFRQFETRERLLAEAYAAGVQRYTEQLPTDGPGDDPAGWLVRLLRVVHRLNSGNGRIYWELALAEHDLTGELAMVAADRRRRRKRSATWVTSTMWTASGGRGEPPPWLVDAFAVHLSAFSTAALSVDFGRRPDDVAEVCARVLLAALDVALADAAAASPAR